MDNQKQCKTHSRLFISKWYK